MTKDEAIKRFGTQVKLAAALGCSQGTIAGWKAIPPWRQLQIENLTGGDLRAGPECDRYRVPHVAPDAPATGPGALDEQAAA